MASVPYARLRFGGKQYDVETWSCGIALATAGTPTNSQLFAYLGLVADAIATRLTSILGGLCTAATDYSYLAIYGYEAGSSKAISQAQLAITPITGDGSGGLPPQLSVVAGLYGGAPGRKNKGRIYLPLTDSTAVSGGHLVDGQTNNTSVTIAALLNDLGDQPLAGSNPTPSIVGSSATAVPVSIGSVVVDNVVDTQRRRRDKMPSTKVTVTPV